MDLRSTHLPMAALAVAGVAAGLGCGPGVPPGGSSSTGLAPQVQSRRADGRLQGPPKKEWRYLSKQEKTSQSPLSG